MLRDFLENTSLKLSYGVPKIYRDHPTAISIRNEGKKMKKYPYKKHTERRSILLLRDLAVLKLKKLKRNWVIFVKDASLIFKKFMVNWASTTLRHII